MRVRRLWLADFRNYEAVDLELAEGLTVVVGGNAEGKTNLLEALVYLGTLSSFRGAPPDAMIRSGCTRAVVRGEADHEGRNLLVEAELTATGRGRLSVNRQPLRRVDDLLTMLRMTVFSPDDLVLVKGGPAGRRRYLDDTLAALHGRYGALRRDVERVLRQRNALLAQAKGRLSGEIETTLDVWDAKLASAGTALGDARADLVERLGPFLAEAYGQLAGEGVTASLRYEAPWRADGLAAALAASRGDDVRRGLTLVGPHRDEVALTLGARPARTHASQGEQRSLALALRLASHRLLTEAVGSPPVLALDDVFSELDEQRSRSLVLHVPPGQAVLTTTGSVPAGTHPDRVVRIGGGRILEAG